VVYWGESEAGLKGGTVVCSVGYGRCIRCCISVSYIVWRREADWAGSGHAGGGTISRSRRLLFAGFLADDVRGGGRGCV